MGEELHARGQDDSHHRLLLGTESIYGGSIGFPPLKPGEFRLLDVCEDSDVRGALICSLHTTALDGCTIPEYVALSYTWQDTADFRYNRPARAGFSWRVTINGVEINHPTNLPWIIRMAYDYRAGKAFLGTHASGVAKLSFWIDALCINQGDPRERSAQVARMADIYSRSKMVLVVLGEQLGFEYELESARLQSAFIFEAFEERVQRSEARTRRNVLSMLKHPYWRRAWIIQELVNAPAAVILLGHWTMSPAISLQELLASIQEVLRPDHINMVRLSNRRQAVMDAIEQVLAVDELRSAAKPGLLYVLQKTRNAKCTDSRDAVYAKLALANDAWSSTLRPDYATSIVDLLINVTSEFIAADRILYAICLAEPSDLALPSWVVDWTVIGRRRPIYADLLPSASSSLSCGIVTRTGIDRANGTLHVDGVLLDTLHSSTETTTAHESNIATCVESDDPQRWRADSVILIVGRTLVAGQVSPLTGPDSDDSRLCVTLLALRAAQMFGHKGPEPIWSYMFRWKDGLSDLDLWFLQSKDLVLHGKLFSDWIAAWFSAFGTEACEWVVRYRRMEISRVVEEYERCVGQMLRGRMVRSTGSGAPVLVPDHAQAGDLVCILFECPVPVVLRPMNDRYSLVGECYFDNFFNGKGFDLLDEEDSEQVRFNIR